MGIADNQVPGDWNARCSMCGFKRKASTMVKNWQGMFRCPEHNEQRQPQDFVKAVVDNPAPPWTQPGGTTNYATGFCFPNNMSAVPGQATPGCMIPGYLSPAYITGAI